MSYSEKDGRVVLTMSREELRDFMLTLGEAHGDRHGGSHPGWMNCECRLAQWIRDICDRLNSGNPNYTPYQVPEAKP
jgi:hypothetical protein